MVARQWIAKRARSPSTPGLASSPRAAGQPPNAGRSTLRPALPKDRLIPRQSGLAGRRLRLEGRLARVPDRDDRPDVSVGRKAEDPADLGAHIGSDPGDA